MSRFGSIVGLIMMVGGVVGLVLCRQVLSSAPVVIVLQVCAVALMVWARHTFGRRSFHATATPTAGGMVTTGPYRWIRHPIYTAVSLFAWACVLGNASACTAGMAVVITAGGVLRMLAEESLLRVSYPGYAAYAHSTKRMVPYIF